MSATALKPETFKSLRENFGNLYKKMNSVYGRFNIQLKKLIELATESKAIADKKSRGNECTARQPF